VTDEKTVTKEGGADTKTKNDLIKAAEDHEDIKAWKSSRRAMDQFQDLVKSGADGAAIANFIAGKGGLGQGSFGPAMVEFVDKMGWAGKKVEELRTIFGDGVRPELLKKIGTGLAAQTGTGFLRASKAIKHYTTEYRRAGINPDVLTGGQTSSEIAEQVGAAPAAYQGRK
jgi:hypothetical protein